MHNPGGVAPSSRSKNPVGQSGRVSPNSATSSSDVCPSCGSANVATLVFGYPSEETVARARRSEVMLGGCRCYGDGRDPRWGCFDCGTRWGEVIPLPGPR
jgi:hypothetical protein